MEEEQLTKRERKRRNREEKRKEEKSTEKKNSLNKLIAVVLVILGAFFVWKVLTSGNSTGSSSTETSQANADLKEVTSTDHVEGNAESSIVVMEYGDYQCPACGLYYPITKSLMEKYGDKIAFVFRHFPIRSAHAHAQIASQAAEAAGIQGKYWEMHDKLYENQDTWSKERDPRDTFANYAKDIGVADIEKFKTDMNSDTVKSIVDKSYENALKIGINSTPTMLVNGQKFDRPPALEDLSKLIDEELAKQDAAKEASDSAQTK